MSEDSLETDSTTTIDQSQNSSSTSADSGVTDTSQADVSQEASTPLAGTSSESPAQAAQISEDGDPGQQSAETTETSEDEKTFQKRYFDTRSAFNRTTQENQALKQQFIELQQQFQTMRQQYADVKPEEVQEYRSSKALKPWDEGSSEHSTFLNLVSKAEFFDELADGETDPQELQKLQQRMVKAIGPDGLKMLDAWKVDVRQQERERRLNPKAFYQKMVREQAQPVIRETLQSSNQRYQEAMRGKSDAEKWVTENKEVATPENRQKVVKLMESGMPLEVATAIVERDHYRSQVSSGMKAKQSAEEKERLLQGNAAGAITRNPSSGKKLDVSKHLKDKGIQGRAMIDELMNLDREGLLP